MRKTIENSLSLLTKGQVLIATSTTRDAKVPAFKRIRVMVYIDGDCVLDRRYTKNCDAMKSFDAVADEFIVDLMNWWKTYEAV